MQPLITKLQRCLPDVRFVAGQQFCWSPETSEIFYNKAAASRQDTWSLLHETGHALLDHGGYHSDYELIQLEIAAWTRASSLASSLGLAIEEDHIQDCLDTYRDWLYKRSICPDCNNTCLQQDDHMHYRCFNCHTVWRVSTNRFCRAYRATKNIPQTAPPYLTL